MCQYKYEDNKGNEGTAYFNEESEMYEDISQIMQDIYDNLCVGFENADVTWLNRLLDAGNTTEIYIPNTDIFYRITVED